MVQQDFVVAAEIAVKRGNVTLDEFVAESCTHWKAPPGLVNLSGRGMLAV